MWAVHVLVSKASWTFRKKNTLHDLPSKVADSLGIMATWWARRSIEIPIEVLAKKISAAPTGVWPDGVSPEYTIPIIQDHESTGAVVSDSPAIATYLDKTYPSSGPVLFPAETMASQLTLTDAANDAFQYLRMNEQTTVHMGERLSGTYTLTAPEGEERKKVWARTTENLRKTNKWFEGSEGDFVMGDEPCFADTVMSTFLWLIGSRIGRESEEGKDNVTWHDRRWGKHPDRIEPFEGVA
ncbi:hypothetical protein IW261DRAFT_1423118 [Armillaria novae-zelandiae]|uniref:Glutathione S-transferase UstS-like C-terminal domain-containing protein n=1 Tax=Armillaria novae-zelandiae TaxID=153914 RepID=A0AA39NYJ7_9AGAR|nr:hypothetical protein IW261DRAFT_1423118 [Armillaria novae-zelandiae]